MRTFELPGTSRETEFIEKGGGRERRRANERLVIEACPRRMKLNGGGSVFESFRELATSTKAAGNTAPRPRKGSPYYTVIIANKIRTIIVRCKKKKIKKEKIRNLTLNSRRKSLLYFSLKRKKKRMMNLKIVQNIVRVVTIDKSAISFNGKSYL